jgi:hypothetical protein
MKKPSTLIQAITSAVEDAAKVNGSTQTKPAAILWTDADAQWAPLMTRLRAELPALAGLGPGFLPRIPGLSVAA